MKKNRLRDQNTVLCLVCNRTIPMRKTRITRRTFSTGLGVSKSPVMIENETRPAGFYFGVGFDSGVICRRIEHDTPPAVDAIKPTSGGCC
jgi:hypothetical protein